MDNLSGWMDGWMEGDRTEQTASKGKRFERQLPIAAMIRDREGGRGNEGETEALLVAPSPLSSLAQRTVSTYVRL